MNARKSRRPTVWGGGPRYTRREWWRHFFKGCWPSPRPMNGSWVWSARYCKVCGRYPVGRWRIGDPA